jgi:iron(III) transport system ATP-binding protein
MSKVTLKGLSKSFGDVCVVQNIDLEIADHEFVSFLGPSGCGKTTTLRMIAGFDMPSEGDIFIGDQCVSSVSRKIFVPTEERKVGMVFQNYAVWPHMDVFKNVAYPLLIQKHKKNEITAKVMQVLSMVKLAGMEKRYPHQLSGGQQQRVALARALVMEPEVMLLDEPLSNLDAKLREEMRFEIKDIQKRTGVTIIYVTHDQSEAMAMSDRILLLHNAQVQQIGVPSELYEKPQNQFVADFIGLINFMKVLTIQENGRYGIRFSEADDASFLFSDRVEKAGEERILAIRPENIRIVPLSEGVFRGKIQKKVYLGNICDYRIAFGGCLLRVESAANTRYDSEKEVGLVFDDFVLF